MYDFTKGSNNELFIFSLTTSVVLGNFRIPHYYKIFGSIQLGAKKKLVLKALHFSLLQGKLYRQGQDQVLKCCLQDLEIPIMLQEMHERIDGGHFSSEIIVCKILDVKY